MGILNFDRDDRLAVLRRVPLFSECTNAELKLVRSQMTTIEREAGDVLIEEGTTGSEFFVILQGSASVWRDGRILDHLVAGSFFGEISLLDGKLRTASVRAGRQSSFLSWRGATQNAQLLHPFAHATDSSRARARLRKADEALDAGFLLNGSENQASVLDRGNGPW